MLGWNEAILQFPNGLQSGERSFAVRITRVSDSKMVEAMITLHVKRSLVMGIDLGTTYACMAYVNDDGSNDIIPIPLDHESICMPMNIAFHSLSSLAHMKEHHSSQSSSSRVSPIMMGMAAKKLVSLIPDRVFRDMKRIIGRSPNDDVVHDFQAKMPFTVIDCPHHR